MSTSIPRGVQREIRLAHPREVQHVIRAISGVGIVRGLVDDGQWGNGVDQLQAVWDGPIAPVETAPSPHSSPLHLVPEEFLDDETEETSQEGEYFLEVPELEIPLSKLKAFAALPSQLSNTYSTQEITASLTTDLMATLMTDLHERINRTGSSSSDKTDVCDRLRPLIEGLVRTKNLRESITEWRGVVLGEAQGILQQVLPLFLDFDFD
jgi:vacuolar protein sorting-associated protein 54